MRKLTLVLALVALLVIVSTAVVSASGVNWDGDPSFVIEGNLWGHVVAGWAEDESPQADYRWEVKKKGDRIELKGCARKEGDDQQLRVRVWLSEGRNGEPIARKEVRGRADDHWICTTVKAKVGHHDDGNHD